MLYVAKLYSDEYDGIKEGLEILISGVENKENHQELNMMDE